MGQSCGRNINFLWLICVENNEVYFTVLNNIFKMRRYQCISRLKILERMLLRSTSPLSESYWSIDYLATVNYLHISDIFKLK